MHAAVLPKFAAAALLLSAVHGKGVCHCCPAHALQYLSCPFPANLGKLERLEQLDLTMNDLTGSLDKEVVEGAPQL